MEAVSLANAGETFIATKRHGQAQIWGGVAPSLGVIGNRFLALVDVRCVRIAPMYLFHFRFAFARIDKYADDHMAQYLHPKARKAVKQSRRVSVGYARNLKKGNPYDGQHNEQT